MNNKGFTLIEIMIAVAVIGILLVVALPSYQRYIARGEVDRCLKVITPARMTADSIIQVNNGDASSISAAPQPSTTVGLPAAANDDCDGGFAAAGDANGNVTISGSVNTSVANTTFTWTRAAANGQWSCDAVPDTLGTQTCP